MSDRDAIDNLLDRIYMNWMRKESVDLVNLSETTIVANLCHLLSKLIGNGNWIDI